MTHRCFPGLGSGLGDLQQNTLSCADLATRVIADGGAPAPRADAVGGPAAPRGGGHYVALFMRPMEACSFPHCGPDFHFLRRDEDGGFGRGTGCQRPQLRLHRGQP
jgi:hypothetical protein